MIDLLICIRCHKELALVLDTAKSVAANTNTKHTQVVFAVDGGNFAPQLIQVVGEERVYASPRLWKWGPGLYGLLADSITHFRTKFEFQHFMSIDYDTLFLGPRVDTRVLELITNDRVGLIGCEVKQNKHCAALYTQQRDLLWKTFGKPPSTYIAGEGVQGGCFVLTSALLAQMEQRGMLKDPYRNACDITRMSDDHLIALFTFLCGLDVISMRAFADCRWVAQEDPRGLEKKGVLIFHPTKINPRNPSLSTEKAIRNYFRKLRGEGDLK